MLLESFNFIMKTPLSLPPTPSSKAGQGAALGRGLVLLAWRVPAWLSTGSSAHAQFPASFPPPRGPSSWFRGVTDGQGSASSSQDIIRRWRSEHCALGFALAPGSHLLHLPHQIAASSLPWTCRAAPNTANPRPPLGRKLPFLGLNQFTLSDIFCVPDIG